MTLILGAKCVDGVTIIADTKMTGTEGTFFGHENKIFGELRNVIFGYAGSQDIMNVFRRYLVGDVIILRDSSEKYTDENLDSKMKEIMLTLKRCRLGQYYGLRLMVACLLPYQKPSDLYVVDSDSNIDHHDVPPWKTIGSGSKKANIIIEGEWNDNSTMRDFAQLSYSIIKYIEQKQLPVR
jgi:20S proteasome alpha/beta subunit